jgi:protein involved in polysaccharide export with SLBB domain
VKAWVRSTGLRAGCAALLVLIATAALGQALPTQAGGSTPTAVPATPTPDQLRMLSQLPESQRQELMRALGISDPTLGATTLPKSPAPAVDLPVRRPLTPEPLPGPPVLEAGSTIIVKLRLPSTLVPANPSLPSQAQAQAPQRTSSSAPANPLDKPSDIEPELLELQQLALLDPTGSVDPDTQRLFAERLQRNPQLGKILGAGTYTLSSQGELNLPGVATIPLAGLNEYQAARRIEAETDLRPLVAEVLFLPLRQFGVDALEPFGYALFQQIPLTFAPATDVPVPSDYVVGPGDEVRVQLFGQQNALYSLVVNRDGSLNVPGIGPIVVAGLSFREMRGLLGERISSQMIGVTPSVTLGALRSIRVFVLGDVNMPGSFTVSGLSSMTNALFASGGIAPSGSLRKVELKRAGRTVQTLDLYDLVLHGDNSHDAQLQPNDVLFVPPRGATVALAGAVLRPAIYELRGERTIEEVVRLGGGLLPTAYAASAQLERVDGAGGRSVRSFDLRSDAGRSADVEAGDAVIVNAVPGDVLTSHVTLAGHVQRPGPYQWRAGMRLTDLVGSVNQLKSDADRRYVLIERRADVSGPVSVVSADLQAALAAPGGPDDPLLQNLDTATVFDLGSGRIDVVAPLMRRLRQQATFGNPAREVEIGGMVRAPGTYPLEEGMRVSDLIRAGADLNESAYGLEAEVAHYNVENGSRRFVSLQPVDLAAVLAGDPAADLELAPFDQLNIRQISEWKRKGTVELQGEVKFPGSYVIEPGETLGSVLKRAGGLTDHAFAEGSVFLREDLRERERERMDRLAMRLETDLAIMTLQASRAAAIQGRGAAVDQSSSISVGQSILGQLRRAEPLGRLVIDLPGVLAGKSELDVLLRDGDKLIVPELRQEVMVLGEVQYPTSHLIKPGLHRDDYLAASGGYTANADDDRVYVIRADGSVAGAGTGGKWFRRGSNLEMRPGDAVVVPLDIDRLPGLALWQSSTTILYNLAVAVAAIGSL